MAMVSKLILYPDIQILLSLGKKKPPYFYRYSSGGAVNSLCFIKKDDGQTLRVFVDYRDVRFKFECFSLMLEEGDELAEKNVSMKDSFSEMHCVEFFFKTEWEREANPSDAPDHYEQIKRISGHFSAIDDTATSVCVSLVGMAWQIAENSQDKWALFLDPDADDPTQLAFLQDESEIISRSIGCDLVKVNDIILWDKNISVWMKTGAVIKGGDDSACL